MSVTSIKQDIYPPADFLAAQIEVERRTDGTLILRSPAALGAYPRCLGERLEHWARLKPDEIFLAQRDGDGWRELTWAEAHRKTEKIAAALLEYDLSPERPLAILSENSVEYALLVLAAMQIGVPIVPVSPSYALLSNDFARLKAVFRLMSPGLVYFSDGECYAPAIKNLSEFDFQIIVGCRAESAGRAAAFDDLLRIENAAAVGEAFSQVTPDTIAKFLLTSGSTGEPKAVVNTQRMLCSNQQSLAECWKFLEREPPILVDWLPWHHTFGGNNNFGLVLTHGGTFYIDEGKPTPDLIEKTVRNLKEISPTIYFNAPRGFGVLVPLLETDAELRKSFFRRLRMIKYASAALSEDLWRRLENLSVAETGRVVPMASGWGATETAPQTTIGHFPPINPRVIGLPSPGCDLKMIPLAGGNRYELRVKGVNVTPGYWKRPALTAAAFDDEGFYKMGDAGRFADQENPAAGLEFAGRISEEFKLATGTWVHVGALRVKALAALAPIAQDIVIAGLNRDEIGFLIFPNVAACRQLCADSPPADLLADDRIIECLRRGLERLKTEGKGSSSYAARAMFLHDAPSVDLGEITDKGYINQRAVLEFRAHLVEKLYDDAADGVILLKNSAQLK